MLLNYRLVTKNSHAFLDFFCEVWEPRVASSILPKLAQVEDSQH